MSRCAIVACMGLFVFPAMAATEVRTDEQKTLYAIGAIVARSLTPFALSPAELELVLQGFSDVAAGKKLEIDPAEYSEKIQEFARARLKTQADKMAGVYKDYLEKAAAEKGAIKTDSGMVYLSLVEGTGPSPTASDTVKVNYRGTLVDGKEFDSSYKRGSPAEFPLNAVIKCWAEGVQKLKTGGKAKLVCPAELAYGETGAGDLIPPGAVLTFEVELLEIKK